jgi:hypothetical protein
MIKKFSKKLSLLVRYLAEQASGMPGMNIMTFDLTNFHPGFGQKSRMRSSIWSQRQQ